MEQVTNKKKILRILVEQNMNRKIARLGAAALSPPPAQYIYDNGNQNNTYDVIGLWLLTNITIISKPYSIFARLEGQFI